MRLIAQLGVTYVRVEFPWAFLEPVVQGHYDWGRADYVVTAAGHYGVQVQPVIVYCPTWAGAPNCVPSAQQFSSFMGTAVHRYRASIHNWEMWNESADGRYFSGTERQYVQNVLVPGYDAAKAADPAAQVIVSGQHNTSQTWVDALYANGARFDTAAYHDYSGSVAGTNESGAAISSWFARHGFNGQLWLGEFGLQEDTLDDAGQRAYFTGVIRSGNPSAVLMWYSLRDDRIYTSASTVHHTEYYGLAQHNLIFKSGFAAYRDLVCATGCASGQSSVRPHGGSPPTASLRTTFTELATNQTAIIAVLALLVVALTGVGVLVRRRRSTARSRSST